MPTGFDPIRNLRVLYVREDIPASFRDGYKAEGMRYAVECFVKRDSTDLRKQEAAQPVIGREQRVMVGYLTRYAFIGSDDWQDEGSGWSWVTSGVAPPSFGAGLEGDGMLAALEPWDAAVQERVRWRLLNMNAKFGGGGIGATLAQQLGVSVEFQLAVPR